MKKETRNTKLWLMVLALGLLIVISGVQALELNSMREQVSELSTEIQLVASAPQATTISSSGSSLKSSIASLPSMVGGC